MGTIVQKAPLTGPHKISLETFNERQSEANPRRKWLPHLAIQRTKPTLLTSAWFVNPARGVFRYIGFSVAGTGCQRSPFPPGNSHIDQRGAAKSGALGAADGGIDAELRVVISAWPELPAALKSGILAIVRVGRGG